MSDAENTQQEQPKQQGPGYYESSKQWYNKQYESWMPWIEDTVLGWMGQNKTSYVAKGKSLMRPQYSHHRTTSFGLDVCFPQLTVRR
jgi:hypothetical protein